MSHPAPRTRLRVGAARAASVPGDVPANVRTASALLDTAAADGVELLVFGELFLPGYHPPVLADSPELCDVTVDDVRLEPLRAKARESSIPVLVGAATRWEGRRFIATLLVDAHGEVREVYRKQNLCGDEEKRLFAPGSRGATLVYRGWRLGLGICYDASFPEHAREAARDGCHAYVTGGAFVVGGEHRRDTYHAARALDNTCYVVFADAAGGRSPWVFGGGSAVFDPEGRVVSRPVDDALVVADLDAGTVRAVREQHTMLADIPATPTPRDETAV